VKAFLVMQFQGVLGVEKSVAEPAKRMTGGALVIE
jgi:hypothetical protein